MLTNCFLFTLRLSYLGRAVHVVFASQGQEAFMEGDVQRLRRSTVSLMDRSGTTICGGRCIGCCPAATGSAERPGASPVTGKPGNPARRGHGTCTATYGTGVASCAWAGGGQCYRVVSPPPRKKNVMPIRPKPVRGGWVAQMSARVLDDLTAEQRDLCVDVLDLAGSARHRRRVGHRHST